jgi:hypothetical protein
MWGGKKREREKERERENEVRILQCFPSETYSPITSPSLLPTLISPPK